MPSLKNITAPRGDAPFIVHVIHKLGIGGLENGVVNLVNRIPGSRYRHAIVSLTEITEFADRVHNPDVLLVSLHKKPGQDFPAYLRLWKFLRRVRPDIVYTHSLGTVDVQVYAALAGVPGRIHGEHGQVSAGMGGQGALLRKVAAPFIHQYTAVSKDLSVYLIEKLGLPASQVSHIYNGVDIDRFRPKTNADRKVAADGFLQDDSLVIGTVGRMERVKDQPTLARAFIALVESQPELRRRLRLVLIGDGSLREECATLIRHAGLEDIAWLPGERADIPDVLRTLDVFVLPSLSEGTSNTILEAMASGLPVVATDVGGNPELVEHGRTGWLVPSGNPAAMAEAIGKYVADPELRSRHGNAGRSQVAGCFAMTTMVEAYIAIYEKVLAQTGRRRRTAA